MIDYQWPSAFSKLPKRKYKNSIKKNIFLLKEIESFFSKKFGYQCLLFPSARACISLILKYLKYDRSKTVYIDKYSSHCLFNTIGALTNVSTILKKTDLVINNHKWGIRKISKRFFRNSIEDSVDSIILDKSAMFPNNGRFEIFSIPKIIGSIQGGLLFFKKKNEISFFKKQQKKNIELGIYQSKQKFKNIKKTKNFNTWLYHEAWNTYLDTNALMNIFDNLKNFELNKKIIIERLNIISKFYKNNSYFYNRVGQVFPIEATRLNRSKHIRKVFLERHHSEHLNYNQKFVNYFLIPLHFKISDKKFSYYLKIIKKYIKFNK